MSAYDAVLIGAVLFVSIAWLLDLGKQTFFTGGSALVYEDGTPIEKVDLSRDHTVELSLGKGRMEIEVGEGRIRVSNSSCPHKACVNTGWVGKARRPIICVPNQVLIEIEGDEEIAYHAETY
jgi:hypothetical protein